MTATRTRSPRKTATKKTAVTAKKSTAKVTVTETPKTVTPSAPVRPDTLLKFEDYQKDFKLRLEIHNYEINELIKDCKWVYEQSKPLVKQGYDYVVASYNRAFNAQPVK